MSSDAAKALGKGLGIAVLASGTDFGAAADGIPSGVRPFDIGGEAQVLTILSSKFRAL